MHNVDVMVVGAMDWGCEAGHSDYSDRLSGGR